MYGPLNVDGGWQDGLQGFLLILYRLVADRGFEDPSKKGQVTGSQLGNLLLLLMMDVILLAILSIDFETIVSVQS